MAQYNRDGQHNDGDSSKSVRRTQPPTNNTNSPYTNHKDTRHNKLSTVQTLFPRTTINHKDKNL